MSDKERLVFYVSEPTAEAFREQVADMYGKADGNMSLAGENAIREWVDNDRAARIEDKLDAVLAELDAPACERERDAAVSGTDADTLPDSPTPTHKRHVQIVHTLPDDTWIDDDAIDAAIGEVAGDSRGTLKKYRTRLERQGDIIPLPEGVDPGAEERYATSPRVWALRAENDDAITAAHIDAVVGELEDELGEGWYLDALPDAIAENNRLKYDEIAATDYEPERNGHHSNGHATNGHEVTNE